VKHALLLTELTARCAAQVQHRAVSGAVREGSAVGSNETVGANLGGVAGSVDGVGRSRVHPVRRHGLVPVHRSPADPRWTEIVG
jgi:hypothetical protein